MRLASRTAVLLLAAATLTGAPAHAVPPHHCVTDGECARAGWWTPAGNGLIYDASYMHTTVTWVRSWVHPYPQGQVPSWWDAYIRYHNTSPTDAVDIGCSSVTDPTLAKEWFYREGKVAGFVRADSTSCSRDPNLAFTLPPGGSRDLIATFHNVPRYGDRIAIEWGPINPDAHPRSAFINPYPGVPPWKPPAKPGCPPASTS